MFYITIVGIWIKTKIIKIFDMYIHIKGGKSYNKLIMLVLGDILGLLSYIVLPLFIQTNYLVYQHLYL